ncbi:MAG: FRG domain-containing protein [Fulvivirga sp.]
MKTVEINSLEEYLQEVIKGKTDRIVLYRGQSLDKPLLPVVARGNSKKDTTNEEERILQEFKNRTGLLAANHKLETDWDWLSLAQHFGLKTRLLDWSSNPLISLWFAFYFRCDDENSVVWRFNAPNDSLIQSNSKASPFDKGGTKVFRPSIIDRRLEAQNAWFTAHKYSTRNKRFVTLESNSKYKPHLAKYIIPKKNREKILSGLDSFGINYSTVFPDIQGISEYLNWKNQNSYA